MRKFFTAALLLGLLALSGCGPQTEDNGGMGKNHYYQVLDAGGAEVCTIKDEAAVAEIDGLINTAGREAGQHGTDPEEALYTYVYWQEETIRAGEDPEAEREYLEVIRLIVRARSNTITTEILSGVTEHLEDLLPQAGLGELLVFSAEVSQETADALRNPAGFAEE